MKKLVIISIILIVFIALGSIETAVSYNNYKDISKDCGQLLTMLTTDTEDVFEDGNIEKTFEKMEKKWKKFMGFAMMFGNHTQLKDFTQKLNTLKGYIAEKDKKESLVALEVLSASATFLLRENLPLIENIL